MGRITRNVVPRNNTPAPPPAPPPPAPSSPPGQNTNPPAGNASPPSVAESRVNDILQQRRGLAGTINTSFRGILTKRSIIPSRKTLLGE